MDNANTSGSGLDPREFRNALGCFATGVMVMTSSGGAEGLIGVTINSFSSVSLDPPLVSFCIADSLTEFETLLKADHFALNVLREDQQDLSNQFAKTGPDKWRGVSYREGTNSAPIIEPNHAALLCTKHSQLECGDHVIVVARVEEVEFGGDEPPLVFYKGQYRQLT
jgi:3-hydroxy-9,10-secoandrosta-1,3,5(10)-triene-9,17-dione monooxygenase reductase component